MITSEKKFKELSEILQKGDSVLIAGAVELLRDEHPFIGAIGLLTECYDNSENIPLRKSIEGFMNDLKDQAATEEIINEVRKPWKDDTISMLISSCWQSGLNYSDYLFDFVEVFLKGDYVTAIECLTVIEEYAHEMTPEKIKEITKYITESQHPFQDEKKALKLEMITILNRLE